MAQILIVEDDKAINNLIRKNLMLVGHRPVSIFDGETVVEEIQKQKFC